MKSSLPKPETLEGKVRLLRAHFLLSQMSKDELSQLASLSHLMAFESGSSVFRKGDVDTGLMIVVSGCIKLSATSRGGKELLVNLVESGHIFGEIAVIDGKPRSYDATAVADSVILVVRRSDLLPFLKKRVELCLTFLTTLCERLRRSEAQVQASVFLGAGPRLARRLLHLASLHGRTEGSGTMIMAPVSQRDLANSIGMSRETANRQLCRWRREKVISFKGTSYRILNTPFLKRLSETSL